MERAEPTDSREMSARPRKRDWRPTQQAKATTLAVGGAVYSLSHVLNLFASTPMMDSPFEIASHYLFAGGALLIMAGLGSLMVQFRRSAIGVLAVQLVWCGMLFIPLSAYTMLYVFPAFGWEGVGAIDELATIPTLLTIPTVLLGPVLLAIAGLRHRVINWWSAAIFCASSAALGLMAAVPEWEPPLAIGSTIILGIGYCAAGLRARSFDS